MPLDQPQEVFFNCHGRQPCVRTQCRHRRSLEAEVVDPSRFANQIVILDLAIASIADEDVLRAIRLKPSTATSKLYSDAAAVIEI